MGNLECCAVRDKDDGEPSPTTVKSRSFLREIRRLSLISNPDALDLTSSRTNDGQDEDHFSHHFARSRRGHIDDHYHFDKGKELGKGSHGIVRKAVGRCSAREARAVKIISRMSMQGKQGRQLGKEIDVLKSMDHPHIVKLYETFKDAHYVYLVMELCTGGEFFDRIVKDAKHGFEEHQAANYMRQILSAVCYIHKHGVVHRDIKPENFLLEDDSQDAALKLIDFGVATLIKPGQLLETRTGTPSYVAPEVLQCQYNEQADIWSCGVVCYILLSGGPPFSGGNENDLMKKIRKAEISFKSSVWNSVSDSAKLMVMRMLERQYLRRPRAEELLKDVWLRSATPKRRDSKVTTTLLTNFRKFHKANQFKKIATTMIATMLQDADIKELREQFEALDGKGDGSISKAELACGLQTKLDSNSITKQELQEIMEDLDSDGSGEIDWTEFLAAALDKKKLMQREVLWNAFRRFDLNGDGKITKEELRQVITDGEYSEFSVGKIAELMAEADEDGDGEIDFDEFMHILEN